ncbi:zinc ribbon domain-containing protein [Ligilactobacillus salivarius]|uniref:zinc ribbon domain-containing protein n=1 Tax=Ligilactobacillus salivarius TaxID=1624 RepID=UPI001CDAACC9|nr:zinc ribbon domain-containing protein [Ligilactobacillus salivarius]
MFCTKCGAENPEDAKFCFKCGNEMKAIKQEKEDKLPKSFHDNVKNKTSLLKNKKWLYGIVAVAVLLLGFDGYKWYEKHFTFAGATSGHVYKVKGEADYTYYTVFREKGDTLYYFRVSTGKASAEDMATTADVFDKDNYKNASGVKDFVYDDGNARAMVVKFSKNLKKNKTLSENANKDDFKLTKNGYTYTYGKGNEKIKEVGTLVK